MLGEGLQTERVASHGEIDREVVLFDELPAAVQGQLDQDPSDADIEGLGVPDLVRGVQDDSELGFRMEGDAEGVTRLGPCDLFGDLQTE